MRRLFFITLAAPLFLLVSCSSEFDQMSYASREAVKVQKVIFQAVTEGPAGPATKVYADEDMKVLWNADDRISIFNLSTYNYQFAFTGDDGDTAGGFELIPDSGFITGQTVDYVYAAYPYSKTNKLSNQGVFTMVLPAEQSYKEHSFGIGANTMAAVTEDNFLAFKNVGGYLSLRLYGDDVKVSRITIKGNNGEKLAGKASIEMPLGGVPTVTMDNSATDEISVVCNPAVKIGADANSYTDFWFVIPPVYFSLGFTITVTDDKGGVFERTTSKALAINRNTLEWMAALKVVPDYTSANVPFEDANFKAYCVENFDKDGDGEISIVEANDVTEINVCTDTITSMKGIEFYSNLSKLSCSGTNKNGYINGQLTTLDVSKNTALTNLHCSYNKLTSLDISHNTALTELNCYANQLTSLDVSNNTAMSRLRCDHNRLTSLDVSHNTELQSLYCSSNQLTSLDLSHNTALTNLDCDSNRLTSLDVSHNTELQSLYCSSNQLTSLDLSHNMALTFLYCNDNKLTNLNVSHNASLKNLYCQQNQLNGLDLSNNVALEFLFCYNNNLKALEVGNNTSLAVLYCYGNQIKSLDVSHNTKMEDLRCNSNQLTNLDVSSNTKMYALHCQNNLLASLDVSYNKKLNVLDCTLNPMRTLWLNAGQNIPNLSIENTTEIIYKGALPESFPDMLFSFIVFDSFDIDRDGFLSQAECDAVTDIEVNTEEITSLKGIEFFMNLRSLTCKPVWTSSSSTNAGEWHIYDSNRDQQEVIGLLSELDVSHNTGLEYLDCGGNQLTELDLSKNTMLTELYCDYNHLTTLNLSSNTALTRLQCGPNPITNLDLSHNLVLEKLDCYSSPLSGVNVSNNTTLAEITLVGCQLTTLDVSNNSALTELNCSNNQLSELVLGDNRNLQRLICANNLLTDLLFPTSLYNLVELVCGKNEITAIDFSKMPNLHFLNCMLLPITSVEIPNSIQTIPAYAFLNCYQLTEVIIPSTVSAIEGGAFAECIALDTIKFHGEDPPALGDEVFSGSPHCLFYVLPTSLETYKAAAGWSAYADRFRVLGQTGSHEGIGYDIWE